MFRLIVLLLARISVSELSFNKKKLMRQRPPSSRLVPLRKDSAPRLRLHVSEH